MMHFFQDYFMNVQKKNIYLKLTSFKMSFTVTFDQFNAFLLKKSISLKKKKKKKKYIYTVYIYIEQKCMYTKQTKT